MKSKKIDITAAHATQIVSNTIRLQALLEVLQDLNIINVDSFNNRVDEKYKELEKDFQEINEKETKDNTETIIKYFGTVGKA